VTGSKSPRLGWFKIRQIKRVFVPVFALVIAQALVGCESQEDQAATGFVDYPKPNQWNSEYVRIEGWVFDPDNVVAVEAILNGKQVLSTATNLPRADVLQAYPTAGTQTPGFMLQGDLSSQLSGQDELVVSSVDTNGNKTELARFNWSGTSGPTWTERAEHFSGWDQEPFYLPVATSGFNDSEAKAVLDQYAPYQTSTFKVGVRVPILYMRTTQGRDSDWQFDPDFDTSIVGQSGKRIAEDSLNGVLASAERHKIPVLLTLNGGIWSDASGTEPKWDLIDHLEQDEKNCQWIYDGKVFPDDYLSHLPGSSLSPELSRALTLNAYADEVRAYKKRNLQQAAAIVKRFADRNPELFIGVNLDPDVYINPFFEGKVWFDYNPGTIKQFRDWLSGSGIYSKGQPLEAQHLNPTLTLADAAKISGNDYTSWEQVTPPELSKGTHKNRWDELWGQFRRHLVHQHHNDMAAWIAEMGISPYKIFTAQGFAATVGRVLPLPIRIMSPGKNYDTAGVSIEGSKPSDGQLGAIIYGASALNIARTENEISLFDNIQQFDMDWGIPEFNLSDIAKPKVLPDYDKAYEAVLQIFNSNARYASPMAWNGFNGIYADHPEFVSYTSWRNTPAERAFLDFAAARNGLARTAKMWPFGFRGALTTDGWSSSAKSISARNGYLYVNPTNAVQNISSPEFQLRYGGEQLLAILFQPMPESARIQAVMHNLETGKEIPIGKTMTGAEINTANAGIGHEWSFTYPAGQRSHLILKIQSTETIAIDNIAIIPVSKTQDKTADQASHAVAPSA